MTSHSLEARGASGASALWRPNEELYHVGDPAAHERAVQPEPIPPGLVAAPDRRGRAQADSRSIVIASFHTVLPSSNATDNVEDAGGRVAADMGFSFCERLEEALTVAARLRRPPRPA